MAGWGRAAKLPIAEWVQGYDRQALRADLLAGVTVAAFTLPEDLAYAALAGLPPQAGLYASLMAMATYALLGTSRQLAVGPTSALAILVRGGLGGLASAGSAQFSALAALTTLLVGVFAAVAGLLRLGFLAHFLSRSMLIGFSIGAALYIGSTQLAKLFGLPGISGDFLPNLGYLLSHLGETHGPWLLVGLGGLTVLLLADHYLPRLPNALIVVLAATALSAAADLASLGVRTVGPIPQGLPPLGLGDVSWGDVRAVYPLALACFLLSYVEGISLAQVYAARDRYRVDPDRELLALAAINAAAGLAHGLVVGGSGSRSAVSDEAGARSPLAGGVAAGLLLVVILFFAGFLAHLPDPILAAVVLVAVRRLLRFRELRQLLAVSRWEGAVALVTLLGVLGLGLLDGVILGLGLVLLDLLRRVSAPKLVLLGRVPRTSHFAILAQSPECERIPELLLCRVEGALLFANALAVQGALLRRLAEETPPPAAVVLDLGATATLDLTTAEMLEDLAAQLATRRVRLELVALSELARETLRRRGAPTRLDTLGQHATLGDAVDSLATRARER